MGSLLLKTGLTFSRLYLLNACSESLRDNTIQLGIPRRTYFQLSEEDKMFFLKIRPKTQKFQTSFFGIGPLRKHYTTYSESDGVVTKALHPGVDELFIDRGVQSFSLKFLTVPTFLKKTVKCSNDPDRVNKLTGRGIIAYFPSKSSWSSWVCNLDRHVRDDRDIPHTTCGQ